MAKAKDKTESACFVKFVIYRLSKDGVNVGRREVGRYDSQEAAETDLTKSFQKDAMGTLEYTIEKIWTNKRD